MDSNKILARCILLSKRNFGEGHVILSLLTERYGVIKASAFGGQRLSKRFKGNLDYFKVIEAEIELRIKKGHSVFSIAAIKSVPHEFKNIGTSIERFAAASYMQEVCSIVITPNESVTATEENYFIELYNSLIKLEGQNSKEDILKTVYDFSLDLYTQTGFLPDIKKMYGIKNMIDHLEEFNSRILGAAPRSFAILENVINSKNIPSEDSSVHNPSQNLPEK